MKPDWLFYGLLIGAVMFALAGGVIVEDQRRNRSMFWALWLMFGACIQLLLQILMAIG